MTAEISNTATGSRHLLLVGGAASESSASALEAALRPDVAVAVADPPDHGDRGGQQGATAIAQAMVELERLAGSGTVDAVLIVADDDRALAAALVFSKLHVPVARLGAGSRPPAEPGPTAANGALIDRLADLLLCTDEGALAALEPEGLAAKASVVGDPVADPEPAARAIRSWLIRMLSA